MSKNIDFSFIFNKFLSLLMCITLIVSIIGFNTSVINADDQVQPRNQQAYDACVLDAPEGYTDELENKSVYRGGDSFSGLQNIKLDNDVTDFAKPLPYGDTFIDSSKLDWTKDPNSFVIDIQDDRFVWVSHKEELHDALYDETKPETYKHKTTNNPMGTTNNPLSTYQNGHTIYYIAYVGPLQSFHDDIKTTANNEGNTNVISPKPDNDKGYLYRITYFDVVTLPNGTKGNLVLTMKKVQFETSINVNSTDPNNLVDKNNKSYSYDKAIVQVQAANKLGVDVDQKDSQDNHVNKYEEVVITKSKATDIINDINDNLPEGVDPIPSDWKTEKKIRHAVGGLYDLDIEVVDKDGNAVKGTISYAANDFDFASYQNVWGRSIDEDRYMYAEGIKIVKGSKSYALVPNYKYDTTAHNGSTVEEGWIPIPPTQTTQENKVLYIKKGTGPNADGVRFTANSGLNIRDKNGLFEDVPFNASVIVTNMGQQFTSPNSKITKKVLSDNILTNANIKKQYLTRLGLTSLSSEINAEMLYNLLGDASWIIERNDNEESYDSGFAVLMDAKKSSIQWSGSRQSGAGINSTLFNSSIYTYLEPTHGTGGGIFIETYDKENDCSPVYNEGVRTMGRHGSVTVTTVPEDGYRVKRILIGNTNYGKSATDYGLTDKTEYIIDGDTLKDNKGNEYTFVDDKVEVPGFYYDITKDVENPDKPYPTKATERITFKRNNDGTIDVTLPHLVDPMHVHVEFGADFYFHKIWVGEKEPDKLDFIAMPYHLQYIFELDLDKDGTPETYKMIGNKISGAGKNWTVKNNIWTILDEHDEIKVHYEIKGNEIFNSNNELIETMSEKLIFDPNTSIINFSVDPDSSMIIRETEEGTGSSKRRTWIIKYPGEGDETLGLEPMLIEEEPDRCDINHTDRLYWFVSEKIPAWALEEYFNVNNDTNNISIAPGIVSNNQYNGMNWYEDSTAGRDTVQGEINANKISAYMSVFEIGGEIINTPALYVEATKNWIDESNEYNSRKDIVLHIDRVLKVGSSTTIFEDILPPQLIAADEQGDEFTVIWGNNENYISADPNKVVIKNSDDLDHGDENKPIIYTRNADGSYHSSYDRKDYYINELSTIDVNGNPYIYKIRETYVDGTNINTNVVADDPYNGLLGYTTKVNDPDFTKEPSEYIDGVPKYVGSVENDFNLINITTEKVWDDNNDQDGYRSDITFTINNLDGDLPEGIEEEVEIKKDATGDELKYTWEKLPIAVDGKLVEYSITETGYDEHYEATDTGLVKDKDGNQKITFTNTHIPETASISIFKKWDDDNNRDGNRSDGAKMLIWGKTEDESSYKTVVDQNGDPITSRQDVPTEDGLIVTWLNLPVNRKGKTITYKIEEDVSDLSDYYTDISFEDETFELTNGENKEATITNKGTPELTEIKITKVWDDSWMNPDTKVVYDNHDGIRPDTVTVQLVKKYQKISETPIKVNKQVNIDDKKYDVKETSEGIQYFVLDGKYYRGDEDITAADGVVKEYEELIVFAPNDSDEKVMQDKDIEIDDKVYPVLITENDIEYYIGDDGKYYDLEHNELIPGENDFNPDDSDARAQEPETVIINDKKYELSITSDGTKYYIGEDDKYYDPMGNELTKFAPSDDDNVVQIDSVTDPSYEEVIDLIDVELSEDDIDEDGNWSKTIEDLYVNERIGQKVSYTVAEEDTPEGYEATITSTKPGEYTVTNKHEVIVNPPVAEPDETENWRGLPQTGYPTFTADSESKAPGGGENKIEKITLLDKDGNEVNEVTVPGEGKYVLNEDGTVLFTPEPDFVGKASGVRLRGYDSNGLSAETTYTPTVKMKVEYKDPLSDDPDTPVDEGVTRKDKTGKDVTTTYEDEPGKESKNHPGYIFEGWDEEEVFDPEEGIKIVRKAKYSPFYKISYHPNGGTGIMEDDIYRTDDPTMPSKDNAFTRIGYTFTGFTAELVKPDGTVIKIDKIFKNAEEMKEYFKDMPPGTELKLTAQWKRNEYKISYDPNGGQGKMDPQYFNGDDKSAISKPNQFFRDGYTFTGFKAVTKDGKEIGFFTSVADFIKYLHEQGDGGEVILIAQWVREPDPTPVPYAIPKTGN